jgi:hypothetical protein
MVSLLVILVLSAASCNLQPHQSYSQQDRYVILVLRVSWLVVVSQLMAPLRLVRILLK